MAALKKEDVFNEMDDLIDSLSKEEKFAYADAVRKIRKSIELLLEQEDENLYYGIASESLKEDWDNDKDDAYNDL
jgi:hypothetical protein